jgi:hypothetical protein
MDEHLADGVEHRRRRYPRRRQRKPSQAAVGKRQRAGEIFLGRWRGGELERGAASLAAATPKGGRRGDGRFFWGLILPSTWDQGYFSTLPPAAGAPDRVLPRRGRHGSAGYLFRIQRVSACFWVRRWYTNLRERERGEFQHNDVCYQEKQADRFR